MEWILLVVSGCAQEPRASTRRRGCRGKFGANRERMAEKAGKIPAVVLALLLERISALLQMQ
jgi:hypothetical protein